MITLRITITMMKIPMINADDEATPIVSTATGLTKENRLYIPISLRLR